MKVSGTMRIFSLPPKEKPAHANRLSSKLHSGSIGCESYGNHFERGILLHLNSPLPPPPPPLFLLRSCAAVQILGSVDAMKPVVSTNELLLLREDSKPALGVSNSGPSC